jgi:predicted enzyme related to lactoylglutathione lyase
MATSKLGLIQILTNDTQRAKTFYTDLLGFTVVPHLSNPDGTFIMLQSPVDQSQIALQDAAQESYGATLDRGGVIVGFVVDDADATYQDWQTRSITILGEVGDIGVGRMFTAQDPDGNYIQVYHFHPEFLAMLQQQPQQG